MFALWAGAARGEHATSRDCGERLDEHRHCILSFGPPQRVHLFGYVVKFCRSITPISFER
jgi:hypothetical protein